MAGLIVTLVYGERLRMAWRSSAPWECRHYRGKTKDKDRQECLPHRGDAADYYLVEARYLSIAWL
jgi:hypothetical protein